MSASPRVLPPPLWLLVFFTCMGPMAINIFLPSMPSIAGEFGVRYADVQPAVTVYLVGAALGQLIYGPLSDKYGRKPLMVITAGVFVLANVLLMIAPTLESLVAVRALQALGGAGGMVLTRAIVRDCYPEDRSASALGYITMAMVLAPTVAPLIGGQLDEQFGWRASFAVLGVIGVATLLFAAFWLPETLTTPARTVDFSAMTRGIGGLLKSPPFMGYAFTAGMCMASYFAFLSAAPYAVMTAFGETPTDYGLYSLVMGVGYFIGNWVAGRYAVIWGAARLLMVGLGLFVAGAALLLVLWALLPHGGWTLFLPLTLSVLGTGMVYPAATAGALSIDPSRIGSASALMGLIPTICAAFTSEAVARTLAPDLWAFVGGYTALAVLGWAAGLFAVRSRGRLPS
jgi:MFS transporter, DHA1 family, multidrug resistance protein